MTQGDIDRIGGQRTVIVHESSTAYGAAPVKTPEASGIVVWEMAWKVVRRWWKIAIPLGCLLAVVSAGYLVYTFVPEYQAKSWIRIEPNNSLFPQSRFSVTQTQLQLIRTPMVLEEVIQDRNVARMPRIRNSQDPMPWLASRIGVVNVGSSNVFNVTFTNEDPKAAADIANAVTHAYYKLNQQENESRQKNLLLALEEERDRAKREVVLQRERIRSVTGKDPQSGMADDASPEDTLSVLQENIIRRHVALEMARAELRVTEAMDDQQSFAVPGELLKEELARHPLTEKVKRDRLKMEGIRQASRRGEQDPRYAALAEQVARDEAELQKFQEELPGKLKDSLVAQNASTLENLRARLDSEKFALDVLKRDYQGRLKELFANNSERVEIELQRAELRWQERMLTLVGDEIFQMRSNQRFSPGSMSIIREATIPFVPVANLPYKKLGMVGGASMLAPFLLAFLLEQLFRRVSTSTELAKCTSLPVLGEVATLPVIRRSSRQKANPDLSLFRESVDILSTSLLLYEPLKDMRILAVTSAVNSEGKTSISSQIAVSLAKSTHQPTLLIDADLRRPNVHEIFEIGQKPGLAEVLDGLCEVEQAIVNKWGGQFHVIPAGRLRCNPQRLVGNGRLAPLLAKLGERYRYIVIDTPPVLSVSETMIYARHADAVLLCTMRDVSRFDQVQGACRRLEAAGRRPVGVVLNGVPTSSYRYYYGRYDYSFRPDYPTATSSSV